MKVGRRNQIAEPGREFSFKIFIKLKGEKEREREKESAGKPNGEPFVRLALSLDQINHTKFSEPFLFLL